MGPTLGQEKNNDYGNTANYCYQANGLIKGFLFAIPLIVFPSVKYSVSYNAAAPLSDRTCTYARDL